MDRQQKAAVIDEVAGQITEAEAIYAVDYRGISVPAAAELRTRLRGADASFRVVKNTLTERAADQAGAEGLKPFLEGPTAIAFVRGDAAAAAKALSDFGRTTGTLAFKGGLLNGDVLTVEQIGDIARLPSREVLIGRLVGMVASPLTGLATSLNGLIGGIARQLQAIADQGLVGGDAPAPAPAAEAPAAEASADDPEAAPATDTDAGDQDAEPADPPEPGPDPDPDPDDQ
ncbi:MAG: LSU ribosomal protein L10p (P0) [uncultured Solirubrobacteraceae bacterium]|uniref:Large ribosomal subunit protein uL10 n=1 Tax=uncultured Solirubrobacteraceae bacterium TaxID=1162706 RepID=A0A6J4U1Y4_9ACTN|nr:MAG: LSU ribosomal protein L10p (P0) [uncultured Solirubrobacteraceae bacterium]